MKSDILQRRHWKLTAHGQTQHFVVGRHERTVHTLMKALLWGLYLPDYPDLKVEIRIDDRYKPDVISMDTRQGKPRFWGESGRVGADKITALTKRYRYTHFALAKWEKHMGNIVRTVDECLTGIKRDAPFDVIIFREDDIERFLSDDGELTLSLDQVQHHRFEPTES